MCVCVCILVRVCVNETDRWSVRSVTAYPNTLKSSAQTAAISHILASLPFTDTWNQSPRLVENNQRACGSACVCSCVCDDEYLLSYDASHHTPQHPLTQHMHTHIKAVYPHPPHMHTHPMTHTNVALAHTRLLPMSTERAFVYPWWNENCDGSCSSCYISPCEQLANCTGGGGKTYTVPHDTACLCVWFL